MTLDVGGFLVGVEEGGDELALDDGGLVGKEEGDGESGSVDSTRDVGGLVGEVEGGDESVDSIRDVG